MTLERALIVVDVQNDFCPGGALAVNGGDEIVSLINQSMPDYDLIVLTQDWHPANHSSFHTNHAGAAPFSVIDMPYGPQVLWPGHCVQASAGAAFHPALNVDSAQLILRKGFRPHIDSYSAFFENDQKTSTGLADYLRAHNVQDVTFAGLALDYCVAWSALDAARLGFKATVRTKACRAIDLNGSLDAAMTQMRAAGVQISE